MKLDKFFKNLVWFFNASGFVDNFPDAILILNSKGFITKLNKKAQELFLISGDCNSVFISDIILDGLQKVKHSIKTGSSVLCNADVGGYNFYVEINAAKLKNGYCVSVRNSAQIIDDRHTEEGITKFNNEKNAILTKIEPEIKSSMDTITGFSKGLIDGLGGDLSDKQAKYVKIINNNANDLSEFLDKFFEFSYCESLLYKTEELSFDVVLKIKEIVKGISFGDKNVEFSFDYSGLSERYVYTDQKAFEKIIKNILEVSFSMTERGNISITLSAVDPETSLAFGLYDSKNYIQIAIRDTGVGFKQSELKNLCDPYYQADKGRKNILRALRLGSAGILVKRIGGFMDVSAESVHGAIYNIVLLKQKEKDE